MQQEEDFACDGFTPQKWRKDICKNCYQPKKMHDKKQRRTSVGSKEASPGKAAATCPVEQPKVFQRFKVNRDAAIDSSVPAKERTKVQPMEGVPKGIIQKVIADTAHTRVGLELPPRRGGAAIPTRPAPPPGSASLPPRPTPPPSSGSRPLASAAPPVKKEEESGAGPATDEEREQPAEEESRNESIAPITTEPIMKDTAAIVETEQTENGGKEVSTSAVDSQQIDSKTAQVEAAIEPPVEAAIEPPVEAAIEPPVEVIEPPVEVIEPPVETAIEPPVEAAIEPPVEAAIEPPVETAIDPPVEDAIEPPVEDAIEPPVEAAIEPPVEVIEPPVETAIEPPVEAAIEPPVEAAIEPPVEVIEPPVETVIEPPVEAAIEPPVEATIEPPVEAAIDPPVEDAIEPPVEDAIEPPVEVIEPPVEAAIEPPVEAAIEPPVEAAIEPPPESPESLSDEVKSKPLPDEPPQESSSGEVPAPPSLDAPPPPPPPPIGAPAPPPPPPVVAPSPTGPVQQASLHGIKNQREASAHESAMSAIKDGVSLRSVPAPAPARKASLHGAKNQREMCAHESAMSAIKEGVSLKSVPAPTPRPVGEQKVVDVASELRLRVLKQKKKENAGVSSQLEQHREALQRLTEQLQACRGSPSFLGQLSSLLNQVDTLLATISVPTEILAQKLSWPSALVDNLREVMSHMTVLEEKVVAVEELCRNTLQQSSEVVNPPAVERCVRDVVRVAKELSVDDSRFSTAAQTFPVDSSDIRFLLQRAADAVAPLLDRLYDKALQTHQSVFEPTVSKYDFGFRLQNAQRLLKLCCGISDTLALHLQMPKHPQYSDAQLKSVELKSDFKQATSFIDKQRQWDAEEQVQLQSTFTKRSVGEAGKGRDELAARVLEAVSAGTVVGGEGTLLDEVNPELFARIQLQLIKAAVSSGSTQVVDCVLSLRDRVTPDADARRKRDYDWLLEAVNKSNCECLTHLVQQHSMSLQIQSGDQANSVLHRAAQRQDVTTVHCLITLGASPLVKNLTKRTTLQLLALKCFPPQHLTAVAEAKEPLFDLTGYINSPSLSDVLLVSEDGAKFHAHRLVLCAQSPVLKNMLDSDLWQESHNKEIPLPTIAGRVVQLLLQYLYTGRCLFPRDDLNLGIDLLAAADQLLLAPMKAQCEHTLSDKIDPEVVIPLYYAAFSFTAKKLLANCRAFLLNRYEEVSDPGHEALLHLLENAAELTAAQK